MPRREGDRSKMIREVPLKHRGRGKNNPLKEEKIVKRNLTEPSRCRGGMGKDARLGSSGERSAVHI